MKCGFALKDTDGYKNQLFHFMCEYCNEYAGWFFFKKKVC